MIPGQVKYPGLIQVTGFYQLLADFHPVGYRTGYAVHKADRTSQCTVVDIKVGVDFRRRSPGLLSGILIDGVQRNFLFLEPCLLYTSPSPRDTR